MTQGVPKKHHYVPQMLLRRFAESEQRLMVHRVDRENSYRANVRDVGHRNQGHTVYFPGRKPDHNTLETRMSNLEDVTSRVIDRLSSSTNTQLDEADREVFAWFLSLQWSRHRATLAALRHEIKPEEVSPEVEYWLRSAGLMGIDRMLDAWEMRKNPHASPKDVFDHGTSQLLGLFEWRLVRYKSPALVVGDNTLCMSGLAAGETSTLPSAWNSHGLGVGIGTCRRVTTALTPSLGLLLERGRQPVHMPASRLNRITIRNAREFVAFSPGWPGRHSKLHEALLGELSLQRFLAPAWRTC